MNNFDLNIKRTVLLRVLIVALILGSSASIYYESGFRTEALYILAVIGVLFVVSYFYIALDFFFEKNLRLFKYSIVLLDTLLATYLIYVTGGRTSPLVFLYPLIIIFSTILISRVASYVTAAVCAVLYIFIILFQIKQEFSDLRLIEIWKYNFLWSDRGLISSYFHITGFYIVAMLSGYLAEKIFEARKELGESKKSFLILRNIHENILESIASGVITLDRNGNVISVNKSGLNILDYIDQKSVMSKSLSQLFKGISLDELINKKRDHINYTSPNKKDLILGFSASVLRDNEDNEHGYTIIFQDLTEIKNLEERVKVSEKLAVLGQLAAGLAHEVRNPLSAISGTIQIMSNNRDLEETEQRLITVATREIEKLNLLVEDFLLLTTPVDTFKTKHVDLASIVEDTINSFISTVKRSNLRIESSIEKGIILNVDSFRLKQVFWNLLHNSMDAMPEGGKINLKATLNNGNVELVFADEGQGINKDILANVFLPFYTTKEVGTGLGLAIVQKVVEGYNGTVRIASTEGKGTSILISLPRVEINS